jgi:cyclophilin family peptidyl-prolyl cis-trans isomerase/HEAT repeat protein
MGARRDVTLLALSLLGTTACATVPGSGGARTVELRPGDSLQRALDAAGGGPVRLYLHPGEYTLDPVSYTDPSCGNCEDAAETVPTTTGLRVAGGGIEIVGPHADSVVIRTRAGYGLLFEDCADCVVRNVTVTGGERSPDGRATDASVVARRSTLLLEGCVLRDNIGDSATVSSTVVGIAGIAGREGAELTVRGCRIMRNSWDGIALYRGARARIVGNVVDGVDRAAGARVGGGRGVGIGLTWDARAVVEHNLVRRYWKGIGAFVTADADIRENVVEDILTWGIALWGPGGAHPAARIERNVVHRTGACGVMIDRQPGGAEPGTLIDNLIIGTGGNDAYDAGEPYCWQRPIARHNVPAGFVERGNLLTDNRQPVPGGAAPAPLAEVSRAEAERRAAPLLAALAARPALAGALLFSEPPDPAAALRQHAAAWSRLLAAEDARAPTDTELRVLVAGVNAAEPELRRLAVRALGRLERPEVLGTIAPLLDDSVARVQAAAAHALAQAVHMRDRTNDAQLEAARGALMQALETHAAEPLVVAAVAESLGRLRHADEAAARAVVGRLLPHVTAPNETRLGVLRGLYFAARQQQARPAFGDDVVAALQRQVVPRTATAANDARTRGLALATLAAAGQVDAALVDTVLSRDASALVRREAVAAAATIADTLLLRPLVRRALADSAALVRREAVRTFGRRLVDAQGCTPLIDAAGDDDAAVALLAADLLAASCAGDERAAVAVTAVVDGRGGVAGAYALAALAALDAAAAAERLPAFAAHEDFFARVHAARAATALGLEPVLSRLAADPHANVRTAAVRGLARVVDRGADSVFLAQLARNESELLMAAAAALEGSTTPGVAARLLDALDRVTARRRETERDARRALLQRVHELGDADLAGRVRPYLRDFDPVIAGIAADILEAWEGVRPAAAPQPLPRAVPLPSFDEAAGLANARVVIELDDGRTIELRLLPFDAPTNAARFARLAQAGYYDGLTFHRVVPAFVVQGGSPGASEYSGDGPFTRDELGVPNWRGTVGLSTRGRDTGDAQFYINLVDNVRLDHEYTVFAVVTAGMDVVDSLSEGARMRRVRIVAGQR